MKAKAKDLRVAVYLMNEVDVELSERCMQECDNNLAFYSCLLKYAISVIENQLEQHEITKYKRRVSQAQQQIDSNASTVDDALVLKLSNSKSASDRLALAKLGLCLDKLVNDRNIMVRREVAKQRYRLDVLIKDKNWLVRKEVAKQGFGLMTLVKDENVKVAEAAQKLLNKQNQAVSDE